MKSLWFKVIPILACLFFAVSCSSGVRLGNVLVHIIEYHPTADATQAKLLLRFTNENVFPIAIAGTTGKLYLNGTYVGQFTLKEAVGIPQLATVNRDVVLLIENAGFMQQLSTSTSAPSISYRLKSMMRTEVSEDRMKITNESTGQIDSASLRAEPVPMH